MTIDLLNNLNLEKEKYLIVGCSAGPDSMALLHFLKTNTKKTIVCAHINHNLRKESIKEEEYLKKYCKINNIFFESIKLEKLKGNNLENEARKERYKFYQQIINKYKAKYLFLAHHGDDLIETIIMKINRGSNLEGYAGIKKISKKNNYYIIRPFLEYTKQALLNYNQTYNIDFFIDKTNFDTKYTRNRIRHNILPLLKEENINIHKQFLKYSETLLEYNNYINKEIENKLINIYKDNYIDLKIFNKEEEFMQKNILYKFLNKYYNNTSNIVKEKNITDILNIINNKKPNLSINLPHNNICTKEYDKLYFKTNTKTNNNYKIELENITTINNIIIKKINNTNEDGNDICRLKSNELSLPLYIRNRKNGDFIKLKGTNGKKKIKDIFIDKKIPKNIRNTYPIVIDSNDNILWIPNIKKSKFNKQKDEFCDIILKYCEKEENNE